MDVIVLLDTIYIYIGTETYTVKYVIVLRYGNTETYQNHMH